MFGAYLDETVPVVDGARRIEALGFDYLAIGEHVAFHSPTTNAFVSLAMAAGATTRIGLLSSITLLPLYPPALAAKMAAELARQSGGRFEMGVGMGGEFPREFEACGVPVGERAARTEEALEIVYRLMREDSVTFQGRFNTLTDITLDPRPERPPPIWMGGRKARAMARAARLADVWMPYLYTPEQFAASMATIRAAAAEHGRDPASLGAALFAWTCVGSDRAQAVGRAAELLSGVYGTDMRPAAERYALAGSPEECARRLCEYAAAGADRFVFSSLATSASEHMEMLEVIASEVIPSYLDLAAATPAGTGRGPGRVLTACLTFDVDAVSFWTTTLRATSPSDVSRGEFERVAVPRILELLAAHDVQATFFVPALTARQFPAMIREIASAGHEIGAHGDRHERLLDLERGEEALVLGRSFDGLADVVGSRPSGFRAPGWQLSPNTIGLLEEMGVRYDSSMFASDFTPYRARRDDTVVDGDWTPGRESAVWELPVAWELDDFPAFFLRLPGFSMGRNPADVYDTWAAELDYAHEHVPGGVFTLTMHPMLMGRGPRLAMLGRLIEHTKQLGDVRFARMDEVVSTMDRP